MAQMLEMNSIDMISLWVYMLFVYAVLPFGPLLLAHALPSAPSITMANDLKWPRNGSVFVVSFVFFIIGAYVAYISVCEEAFGEAFLEKSMAIIPIFVVPTLETFVITSCWVIPSLVVSAWMERFIKLCEESSLSGQTKQAELCLSIYSKIEHSFGFFFLYVFGISQFLLFSVCFWQYLIQWHQVESF